MHQFTLDNGHILNVGTLASDYTYSNLIDFRLHEDKYWEATREDRDPTDHLIDAISAVYNVPDNMDDHIPTDDITEMLKTGWTIKIDIDEITAVRLYVHFVNTINFYFRNEIFRWLDQIQHLNLDESVKAKVDELVEFIRDGQSTTLVANASLIFAELTGLIKMTSKKLSFMYKDSAYHIYASNVDKFFSNRFKVGEAKEVLEFRRLVQLKIDQEDYNDSDGMDAFRLGLRPLAILARRSGEPLPKNNQKRKEFLDARERHFADIPMNIVYQVMFFFIVTLADVGKNHYINTFMGASHRRSQMDTIKRNGTKLRIAQRKEVRLSSIN